MADTLLPGHQQEQEAEEEEEDKTEVPTTTIANIASSPHMTTSTPKFSHPAARVNSPSGWTEKRRRVAGNFAVAFPTCESKIQDAVEEFGGQARSKTLNKMVRQISNDTTCKGELSGLCLKDAARSLVERYKNVAKKMRADRHKKCMQQFE